MVYENDTQKIWSENMKAINHLEETGRDIRSLVEFLQVDSGSLEHPPGQNSITLKEEAVCPLKLWCCLTNTCHQILLTSVKIIKYVEHKELVSKI
jgi:hypothetical protein